MASTAESTAPASQSIQPDAVVESPAIGSIEKAPVSDKSIDAKASTAALNVAQHGFHQGQLTEYYFDRYETYWAWSCCMSMDASPTSVCTKVT